MSLVWVAQGLCELIIVLVVASIEETAERYSIPKPFIGLILLPIVVSVFPAFTINIFSIHSIGQCSGARHFRMDGHEG